MNILELHPIQTTTVHLKNPATGEVLHDGKKPVTITLRSTDCDDFINVTREILARETASQSSREEKEFTDILAKLSSLRNGVTGDAMAQMELMIERVTRAKPKPFRTAEQERNDQARQLAAVTVDWTGIDAPFSHDEAVALYSDDRSRPYREQLFAALNALHESVGKPKAS